MNEGPILILYSSKIVIEAGISKEPAIGRRYRSLPRLFPLIFTDYIDKSRFALVRVPFTEKAPRKAPRGRCSNINWYYFNWSVCLHDYVEAVEITSKRCTVTTPLLNSSVTVCCLTR